MSDEVRQSLDALDACLQEHRDALVLAEALPPLLAQLRALYPVHRTAFSAADIRLLKRIPAIVEAAEDFSDLAGDVPGVRGDGEILSYLEALQELRVLLQGTALELRVRREIRVLQQRAPGAAARVKAATRVHRLRALELQAWPCRCGEVMTLRQPKSGGQYWGCSTYPRCEYTHQLTDKQKAFLDG
ncbi:MAG: topoisomerase DNA-binding C4 zinc finger domain-containing protein [Myxococcota bacterium]|nr:topoisomerase DNA-binding C4 zinc finger domain-containing protein [Myxococcota bacterium]